MKANYDTNKSGNNKAGYSCGFKALATRLQEFKRGLELQLACSSAGRIVLHLVLAVATCHFAWHYQGIVRELARH
jgi:hypothetical protein